MLLGLFNQEQVRLGFKSTAVSRSLLYPLLENLASGAARFDRVCFRSTAPLGAAV